MDLELDLQLTLTGLLASTGPQFLQTSPDQPRAIEPLSLSILPGLDRTVVGNDSGTARVWSDRLLYMQLALPFAINLVDNLMSDSPGRLGRFGTESMVLLETAALTSLITVMTKTAVRRPRPYMFQTDVDDEMRQARGANESFFSGHTALAFSMATAYSYLYQKKHPDSPAVIPIWVGSHLAASSVALLRVEGGRHFWTDVVTGAAVGSAVGFLVPWLHQRRSERDDDDIGFDDVRIVPSVSSRFFGVTAMWFF